MAAKYGQMTLVSKLCDLLKSADIAPDNYFQILMEATGNAMKENHFALMRKLMDKVPVNVAGAGLPVLGWHREQILHLYRQVRDPLICYQIAMSQHAAVIGVNGKSQDFWLSILKEEYHLNEMSDEGFGIVVNHPEMVYLLARTYYKRFPDGDSAWSTLPVDLIPMIAMMTTNRALSDNDKKILIREIREAGACPDIDKPIQQRNLQRLMTHVTIPKDNHISILWFRVKKKEALSALKKSKNKFLCQHIKDAGSVAKLYAVLKDGLSEASSNDKKIIESCLQEFHEGPDARLPFVVRAVEKYESKRQQKISGKVD